MIPKEVYEHLVLLHSPVRLSMAKLRLVGHRIEVSFLCLLRAHTLILWHVKLVIGFFRDTKLLESSLDADSMSTQLIIFHFGHILSHI